MLQFPRGAERDYIATIGIAAVYIAAGRAAYVGASRDLEASARALGLGVVDAWWLRNGEQADTLARAVKSRLPGGASVEQACYAIGAEASQRGLKLTAHATVLKRVSVAARRVEDALRAANGRGELAWFNRAFRDYRLRGNRSMSYGEARARLRRAMLRRLVLVERVEFGPDMIAEVFDREK